MGWFDKLLVGNRLSRIDGGQIGLFLVPLWGDRSAPSIGAPDKRLSRERRVAHPAGGVPLDRQYPVEGCRQEHRVPDLLTYMFDEKGLIKKAGLGSRPLFFTRLGRK